MHVKQFSHLRKHIHSLVNVPCSMTQLVLFTALSEETKTKEPTSLQRQHKANLLELQKRSTQMTALLNSGEKLEPQSIMYQSQN